MKDPSQVIPEEETKVRSWKRKTLPPEKKTKCCWNCFYSWIG